MHHSEQNNDWWRSAVIYQVYPRSFFSAHGRAVGDLAGVVAKADYLKQLGIDIVWLSPFFKSPMKDYGYDISDYRGVDPMFGSVPEFDTLVECLHARGIKIIIDQVYSHTSEHHPWFVNSRQNRKNSKSDWYVWRDPSATGNPPNNWLSVFSGTAWTWSSKRRQYYLHQFLSSQPDLNFNNHRVQRAILNIASFWFKRKVDGFRLDTVSRYAQHTDYPDNPITPGIVPPFFPINPSHMQQEKYNQGQPETLAFLRRLRKLANQHGNRILLGELGSYNEVELQELYTANSDALHIAYTFALLLNPIIPQYIAEACHQTNRFVVKGWPSWSFSNHDVVRAVTRNDSVPRKERGRYAALLLTVLLALRGTPCIYQGEELGLPDQELEYDEIHDPYSKALWPEWRGRDGSRTPMPWSKGAPYGGFSSVEPWLPIKNNHLALAVDQQERHPQSTLNFYRQFIPWRKRQAALCGRGALIIEYADENILLFVREGSPSIRCAYNFSSHTHTIKQRGRLLDHPQRTAFRAGDSVTLPPYASAFLEI